MSGTYRAPDPKHHWSTTPMFFIALVGLILTLIGLVLTLIFGVVQSWPIIENWGPHKSGSPLNNVATTRDSDVDSKSKPNKSIFEMPGTNSGTNSISSLSGNPGYNSEIYGTAETGGDIVNTGSDNPGGNLNTGLENPRGTAIGVGETQDRQKRSKYILPMERSNSDGKRNVAIVASTEQDVDSLLANATASMIDHSGFVPINGLLKPEFVKDGLFEKVFAGQWDLISDLNLTNNCEFVALCRFVSTTVPRPAFRNVQSATGTLHVRLLRTNTGLTVYDKEFEATATAFEAREAVDQVRQKLAGIVATNFLSMP